MLAPGTNTLLQLIYQAHNQFEDHNFVSLQTQGAAVQSVQNLCRWLIRPATRNRLPLALENEFSLLKNHRYAILTRCEEFMPEHDLKQKEQPLLTSLQKYATANFL